MCMSGGGGSAPAAPPPPAPAPPPPAVVMASASDAAQTDNAKLARLKGRAGLRIDPTGIPVSGAQGGLNIPN